MKIQTYNKNSKSLDREIITEREETDIFSSYNRVSFEIILDRFHVFAGKFDEEMENVGIEIEWDYDTATFYLAVDRLENDPEYNQRMLKLNNILEKKQQKKYAEEKAERELLERLKRKYGPE